MKCAGVPGGARLQLTLTGKGVLARIFAVCRCARPFHRCHGPAPPPSRPVPMTEMSCEGNPSRRLTLWASLACHVLSQLSAQAGRLPKPCTKRWRLMHRKPLDGEVLEVTIRSGGPASKLDSDLAFVFSLHTHNAGGELMPRSAWHQSTMAHRLRELAEAPRKALDRVGACRGRSGHGVVQLATAPHLLQSSWCASLSSARKYKKRGKRATRDGIATITCFQMAWS